MIFNSFEFLYLFPIVFCIYWCFVYAIGKNKKAIGLRNFLLIVISYGLYLKWKPIYALVLLFITVTTYLGGRILGTFNTPERPKNFWSRKAVLYSAIVMALLPLFCFKYLDFINSQIMAAGELFGFEFGLDGLNWALPLGLSFYTFQALGYMIDVYRGNISAEKNFRDYMLFVCFFPQISSGPISKAQDLLPQIKECKPFDNRQATDGLKWLLWGMFMKVVIADRLGAFVDSYDSQYVYMSGIENLLLTFGYTFQIYGDFAGYSFMAMGVGKLMGFDLINNFHQPYLATSITDFWRRWHRSLSFWLRDYVYISLGGNRCGKLRNYWNIFGTFLVSGIWHGANWTFIVWGCIHGVIQMIEKMFGLNKKVENKAVFVVRIFSTFIVVNFAWIFFRQPTFEGAFEQIGIIFTNHDLSFNFTTPPLFYIAIGLSVLFVRDIAVEFNIKSLDFMNHRYTFVRWSYYVILLLLILLIGVFDSSQFIYVNF